MGLLLILPKKKMMIVFGAESGIEPKTTRTLSEYHTPGPSGRTSSASRPSIIWKGLDRCQQQSWIVHCFRSGHAGARTQDLGVISTSLYRLSYATTPPSLAEC